MKISYIIIPIFVFVAMLFAIVSLWCVTFGFAAGYIGISITACGILFSIKLRAAVILPITIALWCSTNTAFLPLSISSYNETQNACIKIISSGGELGFREKCGIYGLNIVMSACAYPFYPEAAKESFLLMFPAKDGVRRFESGFFLESRMVQNALRDKSRKGTIKRVLISWNKSEYAMDNPEARYALALNPCELRIEKGDGVIRYTATVRVEYPEHGETILMRTPIEIRVEEGLFGYLQKRGWFHPYNAEWTYTETRQ
jgi:hypothetical protein